MPLAGPPLTESISLPNLLERGLANPDGDALVSPRTRITWRQLDETSGRLARNLRQLGLAPGERVASLMPNRAALVVHYIACIKAGLVATALNYRYTAPEIDYALEMSGASMLLHHAERDEDAAAAKRTQSLPKGIVRYGARDGEGTSLEELMEREPGPLDLGRRQQSDPAIIFFTSGSTGKPKGVTHSLETFGSSIASYIQSMAVSPEDVVLPGSSMSHVAALTLSLMSLAAGARLLIAGSLDAPEVLHLLRAERPTFLCMLPATLFALVRDHGAQRDDFRSLRLVVSRGDKVSSVLEREFTKLTGLAIAEGYGMTEVGFPAVNPADGRNKPGSVGVLNAGFNASLRNQNGEEVPTGTEGRLWVNAPTNMIGYWNNPQATGETLRNGWLDTGDVMQADEDGYLWFRGRQKQIIVHDGSNISPQEIEDVLLDHPAVASAGIVGVHNLLHGENVRAYITLEPGAGRPTDQELIDFARQRVGYKAPEEIVVLEEMPLNATGKIDRAALKNMVGEG